MVQTRATVSKSLRGGRAYKVLHFCSIPFLAKTICPRKKSKKISNKKSNKRIRSQNYDYKFRSKRRRAKQQPLTPPATPLIKNNIATTPIKKKSKPKAVVQVIRKYLALDLDSARHIISVRMDEALTPLDNASDRIKSESHVDINTFQLSSLSDPFDTSHNFVGMIYYDVYEHRGQTTCPGYVIMKNSAGYDLVMTGANGNHSRIYSWMTSNAAAHIYNLKLEGFSYHCGQFKWKSMTLNGQTNTAIAYQRATDGVIHMQITQLLEKFLRACWMEKRCESPLTVNDLVAM